MKKLTIIFCYVLTVAFAKVAAQDIKFPAKELDTIYANDQKTVALFFPDPIRQGLTGAENYVFTYNREKEQHLGLLQATPGDESNLLVISNSGMVFSYILSYSDQLKRLNYFITASGSIGKETPELPVKTVIDANSLEGKSDEINPEKFSYYKNFSSYLLRGKPRIGNIRKREEGIELRVENIVFNKDELYFIVHLKNSSSIDYELSFLNISVETRKKGKRKSLQKLRQQPLFEYQMPGKVLKGKTSRFVLVLPKFSIAEDKVVIIDLKEKNGERDVKLKIKKKFLNNPN